LKIKTVLSAIVNYVLPHIKADLRRNPPTTLEDLIKTAELSESAHSVMPAQVNFSEQAFSDLLKKLWVYTSQKLRARSIKKQKLKHQLMQNKAFTIHHLKQTITKGPGQNLTIGIIITLKICATDVEESFLNIQQINVSPKIKLVTNVAKRVTCQQYVKVNPNNNRGPCLPVVLEGTIWKG
jgi:hypothetical protein